MPNKPSEERSNPLSLLRSTQTKQEITALPPAAPDVLPTQESETVTVPATSQPKIERPTPPSQRVRSSLPYTERYTKETVHIDNRLHPFYLQLLSLYPNNTVAINEVILKACVEAGLAVPPDLLKKPYEK